MRMTEKNVTKTLADYETIITKALNVIEEMGSPFYSSLENTTLRIDRDGVLTIRDACNLEEFELPISYLLDKKGEHVDEYKEEKEKLQEIENRINKFKNSFGKKL